MFVIEINTLKIVVAELGAQREASGGAARTIDEEANLLEVALRTNDFIQ